MSCGLLKGQRCLSDEVSHRLTMCTGKDVGPSSGAEHDMVLDRKVNQVRTKAQWLHRVCSEPLVLGGHVHRVCAAFFPVSCFLWSCCTPDTAGRKAAQRKGCFTLGPSRTRSHNTCSGNWTSSQHGQALTTVE